MAPGIPLWLDCDPGHDDAFAILLAAHHPQLGLLGISTVHGNASLESTTANAGSVLLAIGRSDIPVYPGARKPFCRDPQFAPGIHGKTGLDGTDLLPVATVPPITPVDAVTAMRDALLAQPPGVPWLVATGTLTNVALLFAAFPNVASHIKGLSIMGGAVGGKFTDAKLGPPFRDANGILRDRIGNHSPYAEFNIYCDPEAAASVISNPILRPKMTLVPLDLSHEVLGTAEVQELLLRGGRTGQGGEPSRVRRMFHDLLVFFAKTYADVFDITAGPPLHDPIAVAALLSDHPTNRIEMFEGENNGGRGWLVEVDLHGTHSTDPAVEKEFGRTIVSVPGPTDGRGVRIPRAIDLPAFWQSMNDCLERAEISIQKANDA